MERDDAQRADDLMAEAQQLLTSARTILNENDDVAHAPGISLINSELTNLRVSFRRINKLS